MDKIEYFGKAWLPAREIVLKSFEERFEYDKLGRIMVLERVCPWKVGKIFRTGSMMTYEKIFM
jgi:hypothetical protein